MFTGENLFIEYFFHLPEPTPIHTENSLTLSHWNPGISLHTDN